MVGQKPTKKCNSCLIIKPILSFYKRNSRPNGLFHICKECHGKKMSINAQKPTVKKRIFEYRAKYRTTEKWREMKRKEAKNFRRENPKKSNARHAIHRWVKKGKLPRIKTLSCIDCGEQAVARHHHKGYEGKNRFQTIPLCLICHRKAHGIY